MEQIENRSFLWKLRLKAEKMGLFIPKQPPRTGLYSLSSCLKAVRRKKPTRLTVDRMNQAWGISTDVKTITDEVSLKQQGAPDLVTKPLVPYEVPRVHFCKKAIATVVELPECNNELIAQDCREYRKLSQDAINAGKKRDRRLTEDKEHRVMAKYRMHHEEASNYVRRMYNDHPKRVMQALKTVGRIKKTRKLWTMPDHIQNRWERTFHDFDGCLVFDVANHLHSQDQLAAGKIETTSSPTQPECMQVAACLTNSSASNTTEGTATHGQAVQ